MQHRVLSAFRLIWWACQVEVPSAFTTALNPKPPSGAEKQEIEANAVAAAKRGGQRPHVIVVSSMPLHLLVSPTTHFIRSALALAIPAFVLYDADPSIPLSGIPEGVQAEELFITYVIEHILVSCNIDVLMDKEVRYVLRGKLLMPERM